MQLFQLFQTGLRPVEPNQQIEHEKIATLYHPEMVDP